MYKVICQNRQLNFNYEVEENLETGLVLKGSEVKSIHKHSSNLADSHAVIQNGELWLYNFRISPYENAFITEQHDPMRPKKLLAKRKQIMRLYGKVKEKGFTLAVRKIYQNERGFIKLDLCLAKGKKLHDKRASLKQRDLERESRKKSYSGDF